MTYPIVLSTLCLLYVVSCAVPSKNAVTCSDRELQIQGLQENASALDSVILYQPSGATLPSKLDWKLIASRKLEVAGEVLELSFDESAQHWKILRGAESMGHLVFLEKSVRGEVSSGGQCLHPGLRIEVTKNGIIESGNWWGKGL